MYKVEKCEYDCCLFIEGRKQQSYVEIIKIDKDELTLNIGCLLLDIRRKKLPQIKKEAKILIQTEHISNSDLYSKKEAVRKKRIQYYLKGIEILFKEYKKLAK